MYLSHFNLQEKPFKVSTDPRFLWLGKKQKEALESVRYGILYGDGYVVLTGDVGTGKTTLAIALVNELSDQLVVARIPYPDVDILDFLKLISTAYGIDSDFSSKASFRDRFESFLRGCLSTGKKAVLVVDEAQKLGQEHLGELMQLSSFEEKGVGLLNIVFVGQNEFNDILLKESNRASRQRTAINYHLTPLTRTETEEYIDHRLKVANGQKEIFTSEAIDEVFLQSRGIPRLINIVCDLALLMTYLEGERCVRPDAVKQGMERLRLPGEKPAFVVEGTRHPPDLGDKIETELTAGKGDQFVRGVVREDIPRWTAGKFLSARDKFLWAGGLALGVVLLGLALIFFRAEPDRSSEASIEKARQEASTNQVEMNVSKEPSASITTNSPSSKPNVLQEVDKVPDSSAQKKTSSGLAKTKLSDKARLESGRTPSSAIPAEPPRKSIPDLLREETVLRETVKGLDERREPIPEGEGVTSQSPGSTEALGKETEEVEPGLVIDWLLEKREKK